MKRLRWVAALAVAAAAIAAGSSGASPSAWRHVITRGFGNPGNSYLLDHAQYQGFLYVCTNANPQTRIWSGSAKSGGDIWRTRDGVKWQRVGKPGLGNPHNIRIKELVVFKNRLYAITGNDEQGVEVWVSTGDAFRPVVRGGFGDRANQDPFTRVFAGKLIVATTNQHGPQIWVSSDGERFVRASAPGLTTAGDTGPGGFQGEHHQGTVFQGRLYLGMTNPRAGGELWRTADGLDWARVAKGGLGRAAGISLDPEIVFKGRLYVAASHRVSTMQFGGIDLYRSRDGKTFERVVHDGFGARPDENVGGQLSAFGNRLYLALTNMDPRVLLPGKPTERFEPKGFELWRSFDGKTWKQVARPGLGNHANLGADTGELGDRLGLWAANYRQGNSLWASSNGGSWSLVWRESQGHPYSEGGGWLEFGGHVYVVTNDLARGIDIWRQ